MTNWNPRFACYATSRGMTREGALRADIKRYPGGRMAGFMLWMDQRWAEWRRAHGYSEDKIMSQEDHDNFDAWLNR